jgi:hypothetical protein
MRSCFTRGTRTREDLPNGLLYHPLHNTRDAQRPLIPIGLRDIHPTHRLRLIGPIKQVLADSSPVRTSEGTKVFQDHPITAGRPFVGFHALPCPTPIRGVPAYTMRRSRRREMLSLFQALVAGAAELVSFGGPGVRALLDRKRTR